MALYIGGMRARTKNFYNDVARKLGYEEAAAKIQDLYQQDAFTGAFGDVITAIRRVLPSPAHSSMPRQSGDEDSIQPLDKNDSWRLTASPTESRNAELRQQASVWAALDCPYEER